MAPKRKKRKIQDMTAKEAARLKDDQVMAKIFSRKLANRLRKMADEDEERPAKGEG